MVQKGDLLAEIDSRPYELALQTAQGQLTRDQALLDNARLDLARYEQLATQNAVPKQTLDTQRALVASVGGSFQLIPGEDVPETLLRFAQAENATQIVLGASLRGRVLTLLSGKSIPTRVARRAGHIDVHLVSRDRTATGRWSLAGVLAGMRSRRAQARRASAEA